MSKESIRDLISDEMLEKMKEFGYTESNNDVDDISSSEKEVIVEDIKISTLSEEDTKLYNNVNKIFIEALKSFPLFIRVNHMVSTFYKEDVNEKNLDWKKINDILFFDKDIQDFNMMESVKSIHDVVNLKMTLDAASLDIVPTRKIKCKECGRFFCLKRSEIDFFNRKELQLPKRCKPCIAKRKSNKGEN